MMLITAVKHPCSGKWTRDLLVTCIVFLYNSCLITQAFILPPKFGKGNNPDPLPIGASNDVLSFKQSVQDVSYDITYDDTLCASSQPLISFTISNHLFLGRLLDVLRSPGPEDCAKICMETDGCVSANFYYIRQGSPSLGQCELNSETQFERPEAMTELPGAIYMEGIRCDDSVQIELQPTSNSLPSGTDSQSSHIARATGKSSNSILFVKPTLGGSNEDLKKVNSWFR